MDGIKTFKNTIKSTASESIVGNDTDTSRIHICGGSSYKKGAHLVLSGEKSGSSSTGTSIQDGEFGLVAVKDLISKYLVGNPNGKLTWNGQSLVRGIKTGPSTTRYVSSGNATTGVVDISSDFVNADWVIGKLNEKKHITVTHKNHYSKTYDANIGVTYGSGDGITGELLMISAIPKLSEGYNFCRFLGWDKYDDMPNGYSSEIGHYDSEILEPYGKVTSFNRLVKILDSNRTYTATFQPQSNPMFVCETEEEFRLCSEYKPSFKEVFDNWIKFGHCQGYQWKKDNSDGHDGYLFSADGSELKKTPVAYFGGSIPGATSWEYESTSDQIS